MKSLRALALCLLVSACAFAQTVGPMPNAKYQFLDANGFPLSGGLVFTYAAGTTSPLGTFNDPAGTVPNPNPVVLDSGGFGSIYLAGGSKYHVIVENAAGVTIWTADGISATVTGNVSNFIPGGGVYSVQYNAAGTAFAGDGGFTYNPTTHTATATHLAGEGSCITGQGVTYAACYGVSPLNADNSTQIAAAMAAAFNPANDGQADPQDVILPCGTIPITHGVQVPSFVKLKACGRGDSKQLVPPLGRGTVLQAAPGFVNSGGFGTDFVVTLGGIGPTSSELFASGIEGLTIDSNNIADGGLMVANCQEMCFVQRVQITNITKVGFQTWGANNNGNSPTVNTPWSAPGYFQGDANSGPYENIEVYGYSGVTNATVPVRIMNETGGRGLNGLSVVMEPVTQNGGANTPAVCGQIWGQSFSGSGWHCEGPVDGWVFGPSGGADYQFGDGADQMFFSNIQYSSPSNGCAVHIENAKGLTVVAARGPGGSVICDDNTGYHGGDSFYSTDYNSNTNFKGSFGILAGLNLDSPISTTGTITGGEDHAGKLVIAGGNPCAVWQFIETTPFAYPFQNACINSNGDIVHGVSGPAVAGGPAPLGDEYWQGPQTLAMGIAVAKEGLNLSAPIDGSNNVQTLIGNALSYNTQTHKFHVTYNGQADASGWVGDLGGWSFLGSNSATAGDYTPANVLTPWLVARFDNTGTVELGRSSVSGTVLSLTNSTGTCTVGAPAGISCPSDMRLKKDIEALLGGFNAVMRLKPDTFYYRRGPQTRVAGFIAQDVQQVIPALVNKGKDGYLTLNETGMIPYLVDAIKHQQAQIDDLEDEIRRVRNKEH